MVKNYQKFSNYQIIKHYQIIDIYRLGSGVNRIVNPINLIINKEI